MFDIEDVFDWTDVPELAFKWGIWVVFFVYKYHNTKKYKAQIEHVARLEARLEALEREARAKIERLDERS